MVVAEHSEVYSLEWADLQEVLVGWPRLQAMVQEVVHQCKDITADAHMPAFEDLEAAVAAGQTVPQHPAYIMFNRILESVCSRATAPGDDPVPISAQSLTLLDVLSSAAPQNLLAPRDHRSSVGPSLAVPLTHTVSPDAADAQPYPLVFTPCRSSIDVSQRPARRVVVRRGSAALGADARRSVEILGAEATWHIDSQGRSVGGAWAKPPPSTVQMSAVHNPTSIASQAQFESDNSEIQHQDDANPHQSISEPTSHRASGEQTESVPLHSGMQNEAWQDTTSGGPGIVPPTRRPGRPPGVPFVAGATPAVSPRDVQWDASVHPQGPRVQFGVQDSGTRYVPNADHKSRPSSGDEVPERRQEQHVDWDGAAVHERQSSRGMNDFTLDGYAGMTSALQTRGLGRMKSSALALSRRRLIGAREEPTNLAQQALHQVPPQLLVSVMSCAKRWHGSANAGVSSMLYLPCHVVVLLYVCMHN